MNNILHYNTAKEFTGNYRGIPWSIRNWSAGSENSLDKWHYYIYLFINRFKDQDLGSKFWCKDNVYTWGTVPDYYNVPIIHDIDFHGGVTFYEKNVFPANSGGNRVKIGCDYSHLYDEGCTYMLNDLLYDVRNTIDQFHKECEYLIWCQRKGDLYNESQGIYSDTGIFRSDPTEIPVITREMLISKES